MFGVHKVLVGVDLVCADADAGTFELPPPTLEAVELALQIGERSNVPITLFTVTDEEQALESNPQAAALLEQLLESARERGVEASVKSVCGRAWLEIIREVQTGGHDLVLVGSRNHRTRQLLLGTTGTKLLRKCPCPVWVARPEASGPTPLVVVADDLTPVGQHCVQMGVDAARLLGARLMVVHALQFPLENALRRTECPPDEIDKHKADKRQEAEQILHEHLDATDHRTLEKGVTVEVTAGPPDVVLQDAIEDNQADLLVMGTIARSGIPGLLVGNTAERLLPEVECSILAIKPEDFESPVTPA